MADTVINPGRVAQRSRVDGSSFDDYFTRTDELMGYGPSQRQSGADPAQGDVHIAPRTTGINLSSGGLENVPLEALVYPLASNKKNFFYKALDWGQQAKESLLQLLGFSGPALSGTFKTVVSNKNIMTTLAGIGLPVFAALALKNGMEAYKKITGQVTGTIPWLVEAFQTVMQGSIAAVCASTIWGSGNPFQKPLGGSIITPLNSVIGALIATFTMYYAKATAEGRSLLSRLPLIGNMFTEVMNTVMGSVNNLFTSGSEQGRQAGRAPGALTPGMAGEGP